MTNFIRILEKPIEIANGAINLEDRSHAALPYLLIEALNALREIREDEQGFIEFVLKNNDIKVAGQAVDPITLLLIKIIFKGTKGKSDLRRWHGHLATALRFLELKSSEVRSENMHRYICDLGGISGCVKQWRKENPPNRDEIALENARSAREFLNDIPTLGETAPAADGEILILNKPKDNATLGELAQQPGRILIVADIDEGLTISNLRIVSRDQTKIDALLARKARTADAPGKNANDNTPTSKKEAA